MNLAESVVEWVLAALPYDRSDPKVVDALSREHPRALLVLYFNWRHRQISAQPRRVMRSGAFDQNPTPLPAWSRSRKLSTISNEVLISRNI
jgi:hypothetical protein